MTEQPPHPNKLADDLVQLWQEQLQRLMTDPSLTTTMAQEFTKAQQQYLQTMQGLTNQAPSQGGAHANPSTAAEHQPVSDAHAVAISELQQRLAASEARIAVLESRLAEQSAGTAKTTK